jgi:DNA-binding transcriptional MerR regulator
VRANNDLLTTEQAAKELGVKPESIYRYIREGKLRPVYEDKWQIDTSKLFYKEDIDSLKKAFEKPGLTTNDVAKRLGVSVQTVNYYIQKGILPATKKEYKGRLRYFVKDEDLNGLEDKLDKSKNKKSFFFKDYGAYLFQLYKNRNTGELARIIEIDNERITAVNESGRTLSLDELLKEGYLPVYNLNLQKKPINKKGFAKFLFKQPSNISSPVYEVIEWFYRIIGPNNMRLTKKGEQIQLFVKPVLLPLFKEIHQVEISLLVNHIKEGTVHIRHNGVYVDTNLEPVYLYIPKNIKEKIREEAEKKDMTIEEYAVKALLKGLENL